MGHSKASSLLRGVCSREYWFHAELWYTLKAEKGRKSIDYFFFLSYRGCVHGSFFFTFAWVICLHYSQLGAVQPQWLTPFEFTYLIIVNSWLIIILIKKEVPGRTNKSFWLLHPLLSLSPSPFLPTLLPLSLSFDHLVVTCPYDVCIHLGNFKNFCINPLINISSALPVSKVPKESQIILGIMEQYLHSVKIC